MKSTLIKLITGLNNLIPARDKIYPSIQKIGKFPLLYKFMSFDGEFEVTVDSGSKFKMRNYGGKLETMVFWEGLYNGWEKTSLKLWTELSQNSAVIFDVGANTGIYSLISKAINPHSSVHAFEPIERVYQRLKGNVTLNNMDICYYNLAISDKNDTAIIYDNLDDHPYSATINTEFSKVWDYKVEKEIQTKTLDTIVKEEGINKVDLVKIDVESHEAPVIYGFIEQIKLHQPTILIELLDELIATKIQDMLSDVAYEYYAINEQNKCIVKVDKLGVANVHNYLFCTSEISARIQPLIEMTQP